MTGTEGRSALLQALRAAVGDPAQVRDRDLDRHALAHDASHFLRDADRFLGTTPRRFLVHSTALLEASVRARAAALGAATCALHPPEARVSGPSAPPPG